MLVMSFGATNLCTEQMSIHQLTVRTFDSVLRHQITNWNQTDKKNEHLYINQHKNYLKSQSASVEEIYLMCTAVWRRFYFVPLKRRIHDLYCSPFWNFLTVITNLKSQNDASAAKICQKCLNKKPSDLKKKNAAPTNSCSPKIWNQTGAIKRFSFHLCKDETYCIIYSRTWSKISHPLQE